MSSVALRMGYNGGCKMLALLPLNALLRPKTPGYALGHGPEKSASGTIRGEIGVSDEVMSKRKHRRQG
jgi:hypothetical protein